MTPLNAESPVALSYAAALRGFKPRQPGMPFTYAVANCQDPARVLSLAASNPEGLFYVFTQDKGLADAAEQQAADQQVNNVSFVKGSLSDALAGKASLPKLDYLCADESVTLLSADDRTHLFDLAKNFLSPGGIFNYTYRAYNSDDGALRFLVREFAPEMEADQAVTFLSELKTLGQTFFKKDPKIAAKLDQAIETKMPDAFFETFDEGDALSQSFNTIVALRPRGFVYAGDSQIKTNYIDFAVSPAAQDIILSCRDNFLYEPLKDFTLDRAIRSDIWCHEPAAKSGNNAELFGGFTYGIIAARETVPAKFETLNQTIDLSSAMYGKLIDLMSLMPVSVGDFLSHPDGKAFDPEQVVGAVQVLVACGIAQPMRGTYRAREIKNMSQPRFAGSFNRSLGKGELSGTAVLFASPVIGSAVSVTAEEALVMQALDRGGLADSVSVLLPELQRLAKTAPSSAHLQAAPTAESTQSIIKDTVSRSIVQWYAFGILEAA